MTKKITTEISKNSFKATAKLTIDLIMNVNQFKVFEQLAINC